VIDAVVCDPRPARTPGAAHPRRGGHGAAGVAILAQRVRRAQQHPTTCTPPSGSCCDPRPARTPGAAPMRSRSAVSRPALRSSPSAYAGRSRGRHVRAERVHVVAILAQRVRRAQRLPYVLV